MWPDETAALIDLQRRLAAATPPPFDPVAAAVTGGCFVCFGRGGSGPGQPGDRGWAAAVASGPGRLLDTAVVTGPAGDRYRPGLLALREGPLLADAVQALRIPPDLLLVNATGRDHPRRAGLALHLGAALDLATVGVTHRPLLATGPMPALMPGATAPLLLDGEHVGDWLRSRAGTRPIVVHAAWRTDPEVARTAVLAVCRGHRTPAPIREARRLAREARSAATR